MTPCADALIVGGGVIGRAIAFELACAGAAVTLIDAGPARPRASEAAAGILGAQLEAHVDGPLARLCLASRDRFPGFAARVEAASDFDVELRTCGVVLPYFDGATAEVEAQCAWQAAAGLGVERLDAAALRAIEPEIAAGARGGVRYAADARVDPRALHDSLGRACAARGVVIRTGVVRALRRARAADEAITGVELDEGALASDLVILCAGSWSSAVERAGLGAEQVQPARGQMIELRGEPGLVRGVVVGADAYLSPRDDGRVLVGSTVEFVGYDTSVTAGAARDLLAGAVRLVPALANSRFERAWAGLRPHARGDMPLIGFGDARGLIVATGHFRNGVLLAPITAESVTALATGRAPPVDLAPFSPLVLRA